MLPGIDPLNLILVAIAVVVFWRLRSVLGTRTGYERPPADPIARKPERPQNPDNVIPLPSRSEEAPRPQVSGEPVWKGFAPEGSALAGGLDAIAGATAGFAVGPFINGAKIAYEMVLEAYAAGDKQALRNLLSKEVLDSFSAAIDRRQKEGQKPVFQFVGVKSAELVQARLDGRKALITLRFRSEQINGLLDKSGSIVEGDDKAIVTTDDVWTFERDVRSKDPNWKLASTDEDEAGK